MTGARSFLLIESRGEHESPDVPAFLDLGGRLGAADHEIVVFLVQNAVLALARPAALEDLLARGVRVWADERSIADRGLDPDRRPPGVRLGGPPELVRMLMAPDTVPVWH